MNQHTIDKIQPYIDEYCKARNEMNHFISNIGVRIYPSKYYDIGTCRIIMDTCEKEIMEIIFKENEPPTNPLK